MVDSSFTEYIRQYSTYLTAGIVFSTPVAKWVGDHMKRTVVSDLIYSACLAALFIASVSFLVKGSYNPFIYFNF